MPSTLTLLASLPSLVPATSPSVQMHRDEIAVVAKIGSAANAGDGMMGGHRREHVTQFQRAHADRKTNDDDYEW